MAAGDEPEAIRVRSELPQWLGQNGFADVERGGTSCA